MTILVATDLSENSRAALRLASAFAQALSSPLVAVAVAELWERDMRQLVEGFDDDRIVASPDAVSTVENFVDGTLGADTHARVEVVVEHPPAEAILRAAERCDASLIVMGTSGHSRLGEAFFGSTTSAVVRESLRPVLAVPPHSGATPIATIVAPIDLSPCSSASLALAGRLSERFGARLIVLHASPVTTPAIAPPLVYIPESTEHVRAAASERVHAMVKEAGLTLPEKDVRVDVSTPHGAILRITEEESADLVVMGTHGRRGVEKFFLGSTAERVLRDRTCPVLVLRARGENSRGG